MIKQKLVLSVEFHKFLTQCGVVHGIARNIDDAILIVNERKVGYGFKEYD